MMQAPTHKCAVEACPVQVRVSMLMCLTHWRMVPRPIQKDVWTQYARHRGKKSHLDAIKRAIKAVFEQTKTDADKAQPKPIAKPYWID